MKLVRQPDGSHVCCHSCVAMVSGVSLQKAIDTIGHRRGTYTRDLVRALRTLGVGCADKLKVLPRKRPVLPARAIVSIVKWVTCIDGSRRQRKGHWMVTWDGVMYDPGDVWPDAYAREGWTITSYLEIL